MTRIPRAAPTRKTKKLRPVWMLALGDILLAGLVLCVFALFHHVIPRLRADGPATPIAALGRPTAAPASTAASTDDLPQETALPEETAEPSPTPERPLTWREKFAEHFTDTVETGENYYTSPNVSVTVTQYQREMERGPVTYYVADIYIADIDCFRAGLPSTGYASGETIAQETGAILAMNGDMGTRHQYGLCVRNGDLYAQQPDTADLCVLWYDGTVETYGPGEYTVEDILARSPYQIWNFGPAILGEDGKVKAEFNHSADMIMAVNPRSGFGYYEPGHYCFVVADGRQYPYSVGVKMYEWAGLFEELGCAQAYNMDGGASSILVFQGTVASSPSGGGRDITDMLIIREPETPETKEGAEP